jgi:hypothetical protein
VPEDHGAVEDDYCGDADYCIQYLENVRAEEIAISKDERNRIHDNSEDNANQYRPATKIVFGYKDEAENKKNAACHISASRGSQRTKDGCSKKNSYLHPFCDGGFRKNRDNTNGTDYQEREYVYIEQRLLEAVTMLRNKRSDIESDRKDRNRSHGKTDDFP